MTEILILAAAIPLLAALLRFEKKESARGLLLTKPFLSLLFIAVALTGPGSDPTYFGLILAGLICCLAGDVCLIFFFSRPLFLAGLVSFLTGHLFYAVAFFLKAPPEMSTWIVGVCAIAVSGAVFVWLQPHLGKMRIPVVAYMAIITAMVIGAASLPQGRSRRPSRADSRLCGGGAVLRVGCLCRPPPFRGEGVRQPSHRAALLLCCPVSDRLFHPLRLKAPDVQTGDAEGEGVPLQLPESGLRHHF